MSDFIHLGGALPGDSPFYVKRKAEAEAINALRLMSYLMLIEPRQQGKTSLINWLSVNLRPLNYCFALIDVSTLEESSEAAWYDNLCERILGQVDFISDSDHFKLATTSRTWRRFLVDLASCASRNGKYIVIVLDEIGTTHQAWAERFFRTLRDVFNSRENESYFKHITFLLAGCYNPASLIRRQNESPFNVAARIRLPDFTYEQFYPFATTHLRLTGEKLDSIIQSVYYWTDGQPYLTLLLCGYLARQDQAQMDVDKAVQRLLHDDRNHLPPIQATLRKNPELQKYVKRILKGEKVRFAPVADRRHAQLELIGVIKSDDEGYCIVRNHIYARALTTASYYKETQVSIPVKSIEIFISYAHADEELCEKLKKHLAGLERQNLITKWYDRKISPGFKRTQEIERHLSTAKIILLLVSPDFIASDYCYNNEMTRAIERHECGEAHVVPVILRPVLWEGTPFSHLQALPRDAKGDVQAITMWTNMDEALWNTVEGIRNLIVEP